MVKSIRVRLQLWYAVVLVAVIGGFAGTLYYQVRHDRLRAIDARLEAAAGYIAATVRGLPPPEFAPPRPDGPRGRPPEPPEPPFPRPVGPHQQDGQDEHPRPSDDGPRPPQLRDFRQYAHHEPRPSLDRLRAMIDLPESLWDPPDESPRERPYFIIWRGDGAVLASAGHDGPDNRNAPRPSGGPAGFRWRPPHNRETLVVGPHGTLILVGKPAGRELAELRALAWQIAASAIAVLVVGLAGGWLISRSITRPIATIARTASEISAMNLARRIETGDIDDELVGLATILNRMFARLEAAFERQSRFTADASHELRTPLAVIHAHAELALSKPRSAEEYRETLLACLQATSRMATLVDGLLTLARADAGRLEVRFGTVDLRAVVAEVIDQYQPQAARSKVSLAQSLDVPACVNGDSALLARVSSNLISNALRYTSEGGRVRVTLRAEGPAAILVVEDTGCGIAPEDQGKVFERFFRADRARSRAQGGNGLGLAICKTLVDVHRGSIAFTSVPERGTRFEVRLPLAAAGDGANLLPPPVARS